MVNIVTAIANVKLATAGQQKLLRHTLDGVRTVFRAPVADLPDRLNKLQGTSNNDDFVVDFAAVA